MLLELGTLAGGDRHVQLLGQVLQPWLGDRQGIRTGAHDETERGEDLAHRDSRPLKQAGHGPHRPMADLLQRKLDARQGRSDELTVDRVIDPKQAQIAADLTPGSRSERLSLAQKTATRGGNARNHAIVPGSSRGTR